MAAYLSSKVKPGDSAHGGKGLFAMDVIRKGELIVDYTTAPGRIINDVEADRLYVAGKDFMIQTGDRSFFAAVTKEELEDADLLNHSCDPNCGIEGSLRVVAMRDIAVGEEVVFDYAMSEASDYHMACRCGSDRCRGTVTGDDWKLLELQKLYAGCFSDFIGEKIRKA